METAFETGGITTAFIVILGLIFKLSRSVTFQSSCRNALQNHIQEHTQTVVREIIREEIRNQIHTGEAKAELPALPDSPV